MSLLSAKELAVHLSVSEWTVKRAYRLGTIPGERLGKLLRFDLTEVREAMRQRGRAGQGSVADDPARIGGSRPRGVTEPARVRRAGTPTVRHARRQA